MKSLSARRLACVKRSPGSLRNVRLLSNYARPRLAQTRRVVEACAELERPGQPVHPREEGVVPVGPPIPRRSRPRPFHPASVGRRGVHRSFSDVLFRSNRAAAARLDAHRLALSRALSRACRCTDLAQQPLCLVRLIRTLLVLRERKVVDVELHFGLDVGPREPRHDQEDARRREVRHRDEHGPHGLVDAERRPHVVQSDADEDCQWPA
eukprot:1163879-Pleurochrysis_carterae.AAC.1